MKGQYVLIAFEPYENMRGTGPFDSFEEAEHYARRVRSNIFLKGGLLRRMSPYRILDPKDFELNLTKETEE
jgi:hypothetical protein